MGGSYCHCNACLHVNCSCFAPHCTSHLSCVSHCVINCPDVFVTGQGIEEEEEHVPGNESSSGPPQSSARGGLAAPSHSSCHAGHIWCVSCVCSACSNARVCFSYAPSWLLKAWICRSLRHGFTQGVCVLCLFCCAAADCAQCLFCKPVRLASDSACGWQLSLSAAAGRPLYMRELGVLCVNLVTSRSSYQQVRNHRA